MGGTTSVAYASDTGSGASDLPVSAQATRASIEPCGGFEFDVSKIYALLTLDVETYKLTIKRETHD